MALRLAGDCLGEEGLAGAGGPTSSTPWGARTDFGEAFGVLQEVDDLRDFLLDAVVAGDVVEHRSGSFGGVGLGLASANRHDVAHLPEARRCIHTKKRMSKVTGISSGISEVKKLGLGVTNFHLLVCVRMRRCRRLGAGGPTVENSVPEVSVKVMPPSVLSYSASTTAPSSTRPMKSA